MTVTDSLKVKFDRPTNVITTSSKSHKISIKQSPAKNEDKRVVSDEEDEMMHEGSHDEEDLDMDEEDDDYADIEHNFDNEEDEDRLMRRLEEIGDTGRSKHKTFEGIPK